MWGAKEMRIYYTKRSVSNARNLKELERHWKKAQEKSLVDSEMSQLYLDRRQELEAKERKEQTPGPEGDSAKDATPEKAAAVAGG